MKILRTTDPSFKKQWKRFLERSSSTPANVEETVRKILKDIQRNGDRALKKYTRKFDRHLPQSLLESRGEVRAAYKEIKSEDLRSLRMAASRIEHFHTIQKKGFQKSWKIQKDGMAVGESIQAIERAGIYVPGGLAAYPSTVLMNAMAARVA